MKALEAHVKQDDNGIRVWKFVLNQWKAVVKSREHMRKCFKRNEVSVNGAVAEVTKILATGDLVQIKFDALAAHASVYGREMLEVRYEDDDLAVVVKPSGKTMVAVGFMLPFSLSPSISLGDHIKNEGDPQDVDHNEVCTTTGNSYSDQGEGAMQEDDQGDDDEFEVPSNISPTLGQQHRLPCAIHGLEKASNGLVIVAKTAEMRAILLQMHQAGKISRTFRVICHGAWTRGSDDKITNGSPEATYDEGSIIPVDPRSLDADCIDIIRVVKVSPSNEAGSLSTLDITPRSPAMGVNIRRHLMSTQHPVVGDSGNTKSLKANRNKGLLSALVKVGFFHPKLERAIEIHLKEPAKFEQLRIREQKACQRRQANDLEELRKGGLDAVSTYDRTADRPIAYLVGEKDFCDMRFKVSPATLIPRSTTETLVLAAVTLARNRPVNVLDVGTGSGCLLLALLKSLPDARGVGVDISREALEVAESNSALHGLTERARFQVGDLGHLDDCPTLLQSFDLLVCNPPYLDSSKVSKLTKLFAGTEFEPPVALFADREGYGAYELLAECLHRDLGASGPRRVMAEGGRIILEIGSGMGQRVREIFGFLHFEEAMKDKQDSERCLVFAVSKGPIAESAVVG